MAGTKPYPPEAVADCNASTGSGWPEAATANVRATLVVAPSGPGFAPKTGAAAGKSWTTTVTVCVAAPAALLAANVKVWVPMSTAVGV